MELRDFQIGKTYRMVETDFANPLDESQVTPGNVKIRTVLEPANARNSQTDAGAATATEITAWQEFLRVQDPLTRRVHLQHPENLVAAELV